MYQIIFQSGLTDITENNYVFTEANETGSNATKTYAQFNGAF
jgi:hypothetical protein